MIYCAQLLKSLGTTGITLKFLEVISTGNAFLCTAQIFFAHFVMYTTAKECKLTFKNYISHATSTFL